MTSANETKRPANDGVGSSRGSHRGQVLVGSSAPIGEQRAERPQLRLGIANPDADISRPFERTSTEQSCSPAGPAAAGAAR